MTVSCSRWYSIQGSLTSRKHLIWICNPQDKSRSPSLHSLEEILVFLNPWIPSCRGIFKMWLGESEIQVLFGGIRTLWWKFLWMKLSILVHVALLAAWCDCFFFSFYIFGRLKVLRLLANLGACYACRVLLCKCKTVFFFFFWSLCEWPRYSKLMLALFWGQGQKWLGGRRLEIWPLTNVGLTQGLTSRNIVSSWVT